MAHLGQKEVLVMLAQLLLEEEKRVDSKQTSVVLRGFVTNPSLVTKRQKRVQDD